MADLDFYNQNLHRAYPLVQAATPVIPNCTLVDAGCLFGVNDGYDAQHRVTLSMVGRLDDNLRFTFSAPGTSLFFVFNLPYTEASYSVVKVSAAESEMFIVTGDLSVLHGLIPNNHVMVVNQQLEPANIQYLAQAYVTGINLATEKDVSPTGLCEAEDGRWDFAVTASSLGGELFFMPGHNAEISLSTDLNAVTIGGYLGAGEGEMCGRPVVTDLLSSSSGTTGYVCADAMSTINGVAPDSKGNFTLSAGPGIVITGDQDNHTITIAFHPAGYDSVQCGGST